MTIHKDRTYICFECDGCGDVLETGDNEWAQALAALKEDGWISRPGHDGWKHYCSGCAA